MILCIYGAHGLGREVYEIARRRNATTFSWEKIFFIDDFADEGDFWGTKRFHLDSLKDRKDIYEFVIAVGEPSAREKLFQKLRDEKIKVTSLIDPMALVSPTAKIKEGTIICEYATIHAGVEIGYNTLIQPFCDIGHDIKIGDHSVLSPSCTPGGWTVFGNRVFVGMHASILESLSVGDDAIIGMGSAVFRDVPPGATVIGNPARVTRGNDDHKVFISREKKTD